MYRVDTEELLKENMVQISNFQTTVRKLRHSSLIMLEAIRLFAPINKVMRGNPEMVVLGKRSGVR